MKRQRVKRDLPPTEPPQYQKLPFEINFQDRNKNKKIKSNQNFMQKVTVMIHNLVHGDEESIDSNKIDVNFDKNNQTEIVYSVIVGGKPVLASTAAQDMRLVKLEEVVRIMENDVVLKAERELNAYLNVMN
jgi:hypothetical protein